MQMKALDTSKLPQLRIQLKTGRKTQQHSQLSHRNMDFLSMQKGHLKNGSFLCYQQVQSSFNLSTVNNEFYLRTHIRESEKELLLILKRINTFATVVEQSEKELRGLQAQAKDMLWAFAE